MSGVIIGLLLISATLAGFLEESMILVPLLAAAMLAFLLTDAPLAKELRPSGDVPAVTSITIGLLVACLWIAAAYSLGRLGAVIRILAVGGLALVIGIGCSSRNQSGSGLSRDPRVASAQVGEIELNIALMRGFDANRDGFVTRDEFEAGLRAQFERADTDHNGSLNLSEMQAENGRRWQASGTASSPLIDWNVDGVVSYAEFSGTAQSVFSQLDRDRTGTLSGAELEAPPVRGVAQQAAEGARKRSDR